MVLTSLPRSARSGYNFVFESYANPPVLLKPGIGLEPYGTQGFEGPA